MRPVHDSSGTFTLFVYGTLQRGGCRHGPLAGQRFLGPARTAPRYHLFDLGSYPGLRRADAGGAAVHGELYEVECGLVGWLDAVEGAPAWFDLGPVEVAGREDPAWAYYYQKDPTGRPLVAGGRWAVPADPDGEEAP